MAEFKKEKRMKAVVIPQRVEMQETTHLVLEIDKNEAEAIFALCSTKVRDGALLHKTHNKGSYNEAYVNLYNALRGNV